MIKKNILLLLLFFLYWNILEGQSPPSKLDSIVIGLNEINWQEKAYCIEWKQAIDSTNLDISKAILGDIDDIRVFDMLKFFDADKISDNLWDISCEPFKVKDKGKGIISVPTYAPLFGKICLKGTRVIINYYQSDLVDEILFCDKNTLVIRHSSSEKIEVVTYKRYE